MKKFFLLYFSLLKNGSVVKGTVLTQQPGVSVKVKTSDNSIWVFEQNKIDSIVRYTKKPSITISNYTNLTEIGILAGNSANTNARNAPFTLMNISNWKIYKGFTAGIGAGVEFFNETYLPVVADFRYYVRDHGALPFFSLQAGYSIATGKGYMQNYYVQPMATDLIKMIWPPQTSYYAGSVYPIGGMLFNPSIGIHTPINESLSLTFSAGYRLMRHNYRDSGNYKLDVEYNRLSLKVGLMFK
jgi:hypothetical protein